MPFPLFCCTDWCLFFWNCHVGVAHGWWTLCRYALCLYNWYVLIICYCCIKLAIGISLTVKTVFANFHIFVLKKCKSKCHSKIVIEIKTIQYYSNLYWYFGSKTSTNLLQCFKTDVNNKQSLILWVCFLLQWARIQCKLHLYISSLQMYAFFS